MHMCVSHEMPCNHVHDKWHMPAESTAARHTKLLLTGATASAPLPLPLPTHFAKHQQQGVLMQGMHLGHPVMLHSLDGCQQLQQKVTLSSSTLLHLTVPTCCCCCRRHRLLAAAAAISTIRTTECCCVAPQAPLQAMAQKSTYR